MTQTALAALTALLACGCGGPVAQGVVVWGTTITAGVSAVAGGVVATRRARRRHTHEDHTTPPR